MATENVKNDLNTINVGYDDTEEIHVVVTYRNEGIYYKTMLWGDYTTVRYEDDLFERLIMIGDHICDIRLFRTSKEAKAYLEEIEREFMERLVYGRKFYFETGTETRQPLRVSDGVEDVLLDLRLFSRYEGEEEKLSVDDASALVPVPLLRIDDGHVTFRRDGCKRSVEKILDEMVYLYADKEEQEDYKG